jgi:hypothetical protein
MTIRKFLQHCSRLSSTATLVERIGELLAVVKNGSRGQVSNRDFKFGARATRLEASLHPFEGTMNSRAISEDHSSRELGGFQMPVRA